MPEMTLTLPLPPSIFLLFCSHITDTPSLFCTNTFETSGLDDPWFRNRCCPCGILLLRPPRCQAVAQLPRRRQDLLSRLLPVDGGLRHRQLPRHQPGGCPLRPRGLAVELCRCAGGWNFKQTNKEVFVNIITVAVQALIFVTLLPSLGVAFLRGNKDVEVIVAIFFSQTSSLGK